MRNKVKRIADPLTNCHHITLLLAAAFTLHVFPPTEEEEGEEEEGGEEERAEYEEQLAELKAEEMEEEEEEEEEEEDSEARERMRAALTDQFEEENEAVTSLQVCLYNLLYIYSFPTLMYLHIAA